MTALRQAVTYRRWAFLIVGGALLMPYMMAGEVVAALFHDSQRLGDPLVSTQPLIFLAVLPIVAATGAVLPVRAFEVSAARSLLGVAVDGGGSGDRLRTAAWFTLHLAVGGVLSGLTLACVPFALWLVTLPVIGDPTGRWPYPVPTGWASAWTPVAGVAVAVVLVLAAAGAGRLLARFAPSLLGPSPAERAADRLAAAESDARRLAARNGVARELHDSIGHALSVVTVQAAAAGRVLDSDPDLVRQALHAIEGSARAALTELDHVIGFLREGGGAPGPTLADLPALLGDDVAAELPDVSGVPAVVSREAYRIVQEALTNALRYGVPPVSVAVAIRAGTLDVEVRNALRPGAPRREGGKGLTGMRERATLLGGDLTAGAADGTWRVHARLRLPGGVT